MRTARVELTHCQDCDRVMRESPDGLGPKCRAKRAAADAWMREGALLPPRPLPRTPLPRRSNRTGGLIPGQIDLTELEPQETP